MHPGGQLELCRARRDSRVYFVSFVRDSRIKRYTERRGQGRTNRDQQPRFPCGWRGKEGPRDDRMRWVQLRRYNSPFVLPVPATSRVSSPMGWPCPVPRCPGRNRGTARTRRGRRGFPWRQRGAYRGNPPIPMQSMTFHAAWRNSSALSITRDLGDFLHHNTPPALS